MLPLEKETIGDKTQPNFLALMTMEVTDPRDQLKSEVGAQDYLHEGGGEGAHTQGPLSSILKLEVNLFPRRFFLKRVSRTSYLIIVK